MNPVTKRQRPRERDLLNAALAGNDAAFRDLIEPHRPRLHAHCYRMLGSLHDADDALQEALLKAWRGLPRFDGRSSLHTWLYRVTTNACLDAIARRPKRVLPIDYGPPTDPRGDAPEAAPVPDIWIEPYPDGRYELDAAETLPDARYEQREALELAFVAGLQHLPASQRATLVLRDVLGFSALEAAEVLGTTVPSVTSALQRARRALAERLPGPTEQAGIRGRSHHEVRQVAGRFLDAFDRGDVDAILAMLAETRPSRCRPFPAGAVVEPPSPPRGSCRRVLHCGCVMSKQPRTVSRRRASTCWIAHGGSTHRSASTCSPCAVRGSPTSSVFGCRNCFGDSDCRPSSRLIRSRPPSYIATEWPPGRAANCPRALERARALAVRWGPSAGAVRRRAWRGERHLTDHGRPHPGLAYHLERPAERFESVRQAP
jgi:RNA polymerase sigma-70 factor (TIGR02960 family)